MCLAVAWRQAQERDKQQKCDGMAIEHLLAAKLDHSGGSGGPRLGNVACSAGRRDARPAGAPWRDERKCAGHCTGTARHSTECSGCAAGAAHGHGPAGRAGGADHQQSFAAHERRTSRHSPRPRTTLLRTTTCGSRRIQDSWNAASACFRAKCTVAPRRSRRTRRAWSPRLRTLRD